MCKSSNHILNNVDLVYVWCLKYMCEYTTMVFAAGGEGIMLRQPKSLYENGASRSLLKFKVCNNGLG